MSFWTELNDLLEKYHTDLADIYWTKAIDDYISCSADDTELPELTDKQEQWIVNRLCDDDSMWNGIYESIEWYLTHLPKDL